MLKISKSTKSKTRLGKGKVGIGDSRVGHVKSKLDESELDVSKVEGNEFGKKVQKRSQFKNLSKSTLDFFTPETKLAFTKLRKAFLKALILHHFNPKRHIRIETNVSSYAISGVFSQLTLDNLG